MAIGDDGVQVALSSMIGIGHLGSSAVEEKEEKVDAVEEKVDAVEEKVDDVAQLLNHLDLHK